MSAPPKVRTCLWFDDQALEAAEFYCSLLPDSRIESVERFPDGPDHGQAVLVEFSLAGTPYQALNGGSRFVLDEAVSIAVATEDQAETDRLWGALVADGGAESQCGWLRDRFGLSWQIVPRRLPELLTGPGRSKVWSALMAMTKVDIVALEAAAQGA